MKNENNEIEKLKKYAQEYFGKEEKIYIYKCKKCNKLDPVPGFIVGEQMGLLKFLGKKKTPAMECPYCGGVMLPIENLK